MSRLDLLKRVYRAESATHLALDRAPETGADGRRTASLEDLVKQANAASDLKRELDALRGSAAYRLGRALADMARSPRSMPSRLKEIARILAGGVRRRLDRIGHPVVDEAVQGGVPGEGGGCPELFPGDASLEWTERVSDARARPEVLKDLRMAAIMDKFSADNFRPECRLFLLEPDKWRAQLGAASPHLLLIESAWQGMAGEWSGHVVSASDTIRQIIAFCRQAGIPVAFWSKEDPLHFEAFIQVAALSDHVFTTDAESIPAYMRRLGHRRVSLMPFALQPLLHKPIQDDRGEKKIASFFAGAWYGRLPQRCHDFAVVADALALVGDFDIFDRNGRDGADYQRYPARYAGALRPQVPYEQTPDLFREYVIGLTINTVKDSSTMFARRALELTACGASVYSNYNAALCKLFGGLMITSDDGLTHLGAAHDELAEPRGIVSRHRRLAALRKTLAEHTWSERLSQLCEDLLGYGFHQELPAIAVLCRVADAEALHRVEAMIAAQRGVDVELWVDAPEALVVSPLSRRLGNGLGGLTVADCTARPWVAVWHPDDAYGPCYLFDMLLATRFGRFEALGKAAFFRWVDGRRVELNEALEYGRVGELAYRRSIFRNDQGAVANVAELLDNAGEGVLRRTGMVSIDALSYVEGASRSGTQVCADVLDPPRFDIGMSLASIRRQCRELLPLPSPGPGRRRLDGAELAEWLRSEISIDGLSATNIDGCLQVVSRLGGVGTLCSGSIPLARLCGNGPLVMGVDARDNPLVQWRVEWLAANGALLGRSTLHCGSTRRVDVPASSTHARFVLEVRGQCVYHAEGVWLDPVPEVPVLLPGEDRILLVTNMYPRRDSLYRNMFVHARAREYQRRGHAVDVVCVSEDEAPSSYEFEGVHVNVMNSDALESTMRHSQHKAIFVHFLNSRIWDALRPHVADRPLVVWLHGAEIQSWKRRRSAFATDEALALARAASESRSEFWRGFLRQEGVDFRLVFVSATFAAEVWEDLGVDPAGVSWQVIPNPIDTRLFRYRRKSAEQRYRIISIRPHASSLYANDLIPGIIDRLSKHPDFEKMEFRLLGDGPLFRKNFDTLARFRNVRVEQRFVTRDEMADLYRDYGVFLAPSRADTQGVARDEAMAAGLVPVTNGVGSIPEFVGPAQGIVAAPDDTIGMAAGIIRLIEDPESFIRMSEAASSAVEDGRAIERVVDSELELILSPGARH